MPDFLTTMAETSRRRCTEAQRERSAVALRAACANANTPPVRPLTLNRFDLIAEIKRTSPAEGQLAPTHETPERTLASIAERAATYASAGAAMISVLTEPTRFSGDLTHLAAAARATTAPVMRKDFLVDPYQLLEARAHGASAVLLIVRILDDAALHTMLTQTLDLGMHALIEAFDADELTRAARIIEQAHPTNATNPTQPRILLGLNCRDLATLRIEPARFAELAHHFPPNIPRVAESGIHTPDDAAHAATLGYHTALVGTSLMKADNPAILIQSMLAAAQAAATTP